MLQRVTTAPQNPTAGSPAPGPRLNGQPWVRALCAGAVVFAAALIAIHQVWKQAVSAVRVECHDNLIRIATLASGVVDPDLHARLHAPTDEDGADYRTAITPLRGMLAISPSIKYLYTARRAADGSFSFVLDPTPHVDENQDGEDDHLAPGTLWTDPPPEVSTTLNMGTATVSAEPYRDKWGSFMSAWVPLRHADGSVYGVLGADITADSYEQRLAAISRAAVLGLAPSALVSLIVTFLTFRVARREHIAQLSLKESESRFRLMADAAPVMIWVADAAQSFNYYNRGWLEFRGKNASHEAGAGFGQGVHPDDFERYLNTFVGAFEAHTPYEIEYRLRRHDGQYRWVLERAVTRNEPGGEFVGFIGGCVDIHEDRLAREQFAIATMRAESADRAKSEFLANMSHEIRSPLTAILGYADLLEDPEIVSATERRGEIVETIRRNGEHLLQVINDLLDLSKIEAGRMTVESIAASPAQIIRDVVSILHVKAWEKCLTIDVHIDPDLPAAISTDPTRLRQILLNLVSNAIKFTQKGSITVRAIALPGSLIRFDVVDTGIGMTPEQIERLFRPFSQADATTSRKFGGTGLGLCISRSLAQALGGDVFVSSIPGEGTTFTVTVGATPANPDACIDAAAPDQPAGAQLAGARILLVEDSTDNQRLLSFILTRQGAAVDIADDGRAAIERATTGSYDVVLMDMQMPEIDGYEATRTLRARGYSRPIIALTANAFASERDRCLSAGCDDFATKPIDKPRLIGMCANWRHRASTRCKAA